MSNIDERVVKMEFDNKAFEKGASETMSTLDKLKDLLKFDKVKDSFGKLTDAAKKVDVSNVSDGIETVNAKLSTMQIVGATAISKITSGLMDFGRKVVGGTFGQIVQGGINRAFNIEQAKFTIEGLGKDFVQLQEDINYAVSGTAYGFDEAAKAASMMAASGVEAGDEMKASLRGISGMAAMTGDSYSNIADIFGNIAGKGKLSLQEVNRFATRGINVTAKLAEMMDESEEAVRDMVSSGEISFRQFAAAMDEAFGEHATEANKTFNGVMANIKATLSRIGESFIHPLMATNERDILITQAYGKYNEQLMKIAQTSKTITESNVKARASITSFIKDVNKETGKFALHSSNMIGDLIKGNEKAYTDAMKDAYELGEYSSEELHKFYLEDQKYVKEILATNPEYAEKSSEELQKIFYDDRENFKDAVREIPKYANKTDKELDTLYKKYQGFQYNITGVLQGVKRVFGVIENYVKGSSALSGFLSFMEKASKSLILFFNAIAASFSSVDKVIDGRLEHIDQALEITFGKKSKIVYAEKLWDSFRKSIGLTEADFINLKDTLNGIWSIVRLVGDVVSSIFNMVSSGSGILRPISSVILLITGTIGRFLTYIYEVIDSTKVIQNVAMVIGGVLKTIIFIIKTLTDVVVGILTKITSNPILDLIIKSLVHIGSSINAIFQVIYEAGSDIVRVFLKPFQMMGTASEITSGIVDQALQAIADGLESFAIAIDGALTWVIRFIDKFVDFKKILIAGGKLATIFRNGFDLSSIFGDTENAFGDTVAGMSDDLTKSEEKASKKANASGIGQILGAAIFTGISFAVKALWNGFKFLADSLIGIIEKIDFNKIATAVFDGLKEVSDLVIKGIDLVSNAFTNIGDAFAKVDYSKVAASIGKSLSNLIGAVSEAFSNLATLMGNALETMIANMPALNSSADKIGMAIGNALATGLDVILTFVPVFVRIIWNALKTLLAKLPGILNKFSKNLLKAFGISFTGIFTKLVNFLENFSFLDAFKLVGLLGLAGTFKALIGILTSFRKVVDIVASMNGLINGATKALLNASKLFQAVYIKQLIISVALMVGLAYIIGKLKKEYILNGLLWMVTFGAFLALFVKIMVKVAPDSADIIKFNKMMHALSKLLLSISISLAILSVLNPTKVLGAVFALAAVLTELVIAVNLLKGCESSMKFAKVLGPMLLSITASLAILSLFNFSSLMQSAIAIGLVIAALVGAAALIQKFNIGPGLATLSAGITALGVAILAVGGGVFLFVSALQTLSMMGQDGSIASLGTAIQNIASYIPILFEGIGQGILVMVQTLADGATIIADAFGHIVQVILERLTQSAVMFATAGVTILLVLLHGILSAIGEITSTVIQIITAFTTNVSAHMGEIVDSGMQLMISFVNGMANGLNEHSEEIWAAVKNLVGEIVNFILTGLQSLLKEIPFVGDQIADGIEGAKGEIEKFFGDGKIDKATKKGTKKMTSTVDKETKATATTAVKNINKIPKALDSASSKSKKAFKGVSNAAGKEFKAIPKMADIADKMSPKGESAIKAWTKEFSKGAKEKTGSDAIGKVKKGAESVDFSSAGRNIYSGISNSFVYSDWYNQGSKRARALNKGFKDTEDIKSPSKVWAKYGKYLYEGIAKSMGRTSAKFYNAGANAAKGINYGFKSALDLISTLDTDSFSEPTIRPVLDLSNVRTGLNSMNSMFNRNQYAMGLAGSLSSGGINSASSRSMNVSATFNVNGADNPKEWADEFVQELEIQARTYNG